MTATSRVAGKDLQLVVVREDHLRAGQREASRWTAWRRRAVVSGTLPDAGVPLPSAQTTARGEFPPGPEAVAAVVSGRPMAPSVAPPGPASALPGSASPLPGLASAPPGLASVPPGLASAPPGLASVPPGAARP